MLTLTGLFLSYFAFKSYGLIGALFTYVLIVLVASLQQSIAVCVFQIAISFLSLQYFYIEPTFSFGVNDFESWLMLIAFAVSGFAIYFGKTTTFLFSDVKEKTGKKFLKYFLPLLLLTFVYWISRVFGKPNIEQIIFHFNLTDKLFSEFDSHIVISFFNNVFIASLSVSSVLFFLEKFLVRKFGATYFVKWLYGRGIPVIVLCGSIVIASLNFGISNYLSYKELTDFVRENYVSPSNLKITHEAKSKNLLLIYVESLENNYRNTNLFDQNLLKELDDLDGVSFSKYTQAPGTGWTIAALVSTQCGIPLKPIGLADINLQGSLIKDFLPNVQCLGDTLKSAGYTNVFLGGASTHFSGKNKFLTQHGYSKIVGKEEWINEYGYSINDMNGWGLYDDDLTNEAKKELDVLEKNGSPFNLTVLTVDTHFPDGFLSKACKSAGGKEFTDIVKCSVHQVAELIKYAKSKGYLENTNIVVLGDHLSMRNAVYDKLTATDERFIYNKFIPSSSFKKNRESIVHFSIAPTVLNSLGFDLDGFRYGLGTSSIFDQDEPTNEKWIKSLMENLDRPSDYYNNFWIKQSNK